MARLFSSGFELNSLAADVEWTSKQGAPTIQSTTVHGGLNALKCASTLPNGTNNVTYKFASANSSGPYYFRFYYYCTGVPNSTNDFEILRINSSTGVEQLNITHRQSNVLSIGGSNSATIQANTWNYIELKMDATAASGSRVAEARLNGSIFSTISNGTFGSANAALLGSNLNGINIALQSDLYFDDFALNDNTGSFQNSYPGEGSIVHLRPNGAGDSNGFVAAVGGDVGTTTNWTRVEEITPDDANSYNSSAILNSEDLFAVDNIAIEPSDTINLVSVGARMADLVSADATAALKLEIEKISGGTKTQSSAIIPNSSSWLTNAAAAPRNYPITLYQDPDNINWTKDTLNSMQIGYIQSATNVQAVAVSTVWALVEYVASPGEFRSGMPGNIGKYAQVGSGMSRSEVAN